MYPERRTAWIIRGYLLDGHVDAQRLTDAERQSSEQGDDDLGAYLRPF